MPLLYEKHGAVAVLTLSRPQARNAWGEDYNAALKELLPQLEDDPGISCVILTGDEAGGAGVGHETYGVVTVACVDRAARRLVLGVTDRLVRARLVAAAPGSHRRSHVLDRDRLRVIARAHRLRATAKLRGD